MHGHLTRRQTRTIPPPRGGAKAPDGGSSHSARRRFFLPRRQKGGGRREKKGEMKEERGKRKRIRLKKGRREKEKQKETVSPGPASSGDAGLGRGSRRSGQGLDGQLYERLDARRLTVAQGERAAQARERGARELHAHAQPRGLFRIHGVRPRFAERKPSWIPKSSASVSSTKRAPQSSRPRNSSVQDAPPKRHPTGLGPARSRRAPKIQGACRRAPACRLRPPAAYRPWRRLGGGRGPGLAFAPKCSAARACAQALKPN